MFNQEPDGIWYIRNNYPRLKDLLEKEWVGWVRNHIRDPRRDHTEFIPFGELTLAISQAIRMFGPGLMEFSVVLDSFERFERAYLQQESNWNRFWAIYAVREQHRSQRIHAMYPMEMSADVELPLCPDEFIMNLFALASLSLTVVVAITRVLNDWQNMPPESDAMLRRQYLPTGGHSWREPITGILCSGLLTRSVSAKSS
jgi:hypothetical protein